ncbi:hypothetical protein B0H19DRAFT_1260636 [Mycena capillaripes]|nr:hypothetical protein B0H19DRAFT_1260636 [Mycena capillaripes]
MPDAGKGRIKQKQGTNADEDAAAAKLWAVYVSEAEKYDRSLVETWKSDMEGLLIFAALFSAILTAFIIESYKSLTLDPGNVTVHLLAQISQQLAASANGSTLNLTPIPPFTPTATSVVCNALWFISLGFSLACALIATLVQQWSRDFLHKADMRSAPIIRARIFSYLYYGLKRFQMHVVVEVIPLLLHASLLLFFCGLVVFLIPVNMATTVVAATILTIVLGAYFTLTLLPLRYLDCPYRTPLSGTFWRVLQLFQRGWHHRNLVTEAGLDSPSDTDFVGSSSVDEAAFTPADETMVEAAFRTAMDSSNERSKRDYKALVWTMKSLTDDVELEPFVEAIPDLLWGPTYRRKTYEDHIQGLLSDPEVQLLSRIETLLDSCHAGILSSNASQRRIITCCKALWAIATLSAPDQASNEPTVALNFTDILDPITHQLLANEDIAPYCTSATAMMALSTFLGVRGHLIELQNHLVELENEADSSQLKQVTASFNKTRSKLAIFGIPGTPWNPGFETLNLWSQIEAYLSHVPYYITLGFLLTLGSGSPPYHFNETCLILRRFRAGSISLDEHCLHDMMLTQLERLNNATDYQEMAWIDTGLSELLSLWWPATPHCIPRAIILFLNGRDSDWGLNRVFLTNVAIEIHLWNCFPRTLFEGALEPSSQLQRPAPLPQEASFTALWRLAFLVVDHNYLQPSDLRSPAIEAVLQALSTTESRFAPMSCSVIALLKFQILRELDPRSGVTLRKAGTNHPALPSETVTSFPDKVRTMQENDVLPAPQQFPLHLFKYARTAEARVDIIAEYLEHCTSESLPYNALITFDKIAYNLFLHTPIHSVYQMRLASSIHGVLAAGFMELLGRIVNCTCWAIYAGGHKTEDQVRTYREELRTRRGEQAHNIPWLDNPIARQKIKDAFIRYEEQLNLSSGTPNHLQNILQGIESWHTQLAS